MKAVEPDMNTEQLTGHYKKHTDRNYIGAHDLSKDEGGYASVVVTIDGTYSRNIFNPGTRKHEKCLVASLAGKSKDLILNVTNQTSIETIAKSTSIEKWVGVQVKLVVNKVQSGPKKVDAIRIEAP